MAAKPDSPIISILRKTCLSTYPFAFALSIAHAATSSNGLFPAIALVPQTASTIFSASILYFDALRRKKNHHAHGPLGVDGDSTDRRVRNVLIFLGDFTMLATLMTCMVFSWINLSHTEYSYCGYYGWQASATVLGTYATMPFMINMTIHIFFALRALYLSLPSEIFSIFTSTPTPTECPNCHHNLASGNPATRWHGNKDAGGYSFLNPDESDSLYRDIERQTGAGRVSGETVRATEEVLDTGKGRASEEEAREISQAEVLKIVDV